MTSPSRRPTADNSTNHDVTIRVTNVNDGDEHTVLHLGYLCQRGGEPECGQRAYTAVATDADGDPLSYSLSGTDAALFTINPATGAVRFKLHPTSRIRATPAGTMSMTSW